MKSTDDLKQENKYLRKEFGNSKTELDRNHQIKQETIRRIEELERRKSKIARALKHMSAAKMKNKTLAPPPSA